MVGGFFHQPKNYQNYNIGVDEILNNSFTPMYSNGGNQSICSLTRGGIVGLGLASVALTVTSFLAPTPSVAQDTHLIAKTSQELPVVRSTALGTNIDVPWSQPVRIVDPFEGEGVGIFDKNYFYKRLLNANGRVQVISLWQRDSIRFLLAFSDRDCLSGQSFYPVVLARDCLVSNAALEVSNMSIKIGDRVFRLEGQNSQFQVSHELAAALKNSPTGNVKIRLVTESGATVDSEIGKGTVQAWKAIY
jgi:hypothetical protein